MGLKMGLRLYYLLRWSPVRVLVKKPTEKGRGGRRSIARGRLGRQWTRLDGIQRPLFTGAHEFEGWTQSARPKSGCKLGHCRASGGPPSVLAGDPSGPKAAAAAGHIGAASRAQRAPGPDSAVDYHDVFIMDAT
jgi:hypothetical protein